MKINKLFKGTIVCLLLAMGLTFVGCEEDDPDCTESTWYEDADHDGLGNPNSSLAACEQPEGYVSNSDDDDDTQANCEVQTWYADEDGDGLGNPNSAVAACEQPSGFVDNADDDLDVLNSRYLVSADVDGESYFMTTDDILTGNVSFSGNGLEGWAAISVSIDEHLYVINNTEAITEKYELTETGPVKVAAISNAALTPGAFFRYIQATDNGDLLLTSNPNDDGYTPYAIIDLETFTATGSGFITFPELNGKTHLWANSVVQGGKIYFGSVYGVLPNWTQIADSLITVRFNYPSMTNPEILVSAASAGTLAGYRTNGSFVTENGDIYQYNLTSKLWYGHNELDDKPSVFVRIKDGDYDDYVFDISEQFEAPISIWNAWYAGDGIAYANIVRVADTPEWGDLSQNTGTLVEINLETKTVTELNLPKATYVNTFSVNCIDDGKFYIPVNVAGGESHIYEITIGGGADGFTRGASIDGGNVFINALLKNF